MLAAFAPGFDLQGYQLRDHASYWHRELHDWDGEDMLRYKIAGAMFGMCVATVDGRVTETLIEANTANVLQRYRQHTLSLMGLSALAQHVLTPEATIHDAEAQGEANISLDMFVNDGPYSLHYATPEAPPTPEVGNWHRCGNIYLRELRPAKPSPSLERFIAERKITIDFAQATTLYPFLASRKALASFAA